MKQKKKIKNFYYCRHQRKIFTSIEGVQDEFYTIPHGTKFGNDEVVYNKDTAMTYVKTLGLNFEKPMGYSPKRKVA